MHVDAVCNYAVRNAEEFLREIRGGPEVHMRADDVIRPMPARRAQTARSEPWSLERRCVVRRTPELKPGPRSGVIVLPE